MAMTRSQQNRAIRQEALREQLAKQKHLEHVIDICAELSEPQCELDALMIQRKKIVIDTKLKLINKYLPDLKSTEITGGDGEPFTIRITEYKPDA